ncbi:hypothetical protein HanRHA438_Chr12g0557561 [Helianthus annuus]|nr:hypothetical protein HanIR_Chr12g0589311 [Helianthus annuus]KAJ0866949.1 hypothetical protein HanRHA438_Chr12g0557561 [Helianthus annuus]
MLTEMIYEECLDISSQNIWSQLLIIRCTYNGGQGERGTPLLGESPLLRTPNQVMPRQLPS